jgi:hypothetical protein
MGDSLFGTAANFFAHVLLRSTLPLTLDSS